MPRGHRRLRAEAERVRGTRAGADVDLPGRESRPRRARQDSDRRLRGRGGCGSLVDAGRAGRDRARLSRLAPAERGRFGRRAVPRQRARSGLGLRPQRRGGSLDPGRDESSRSCSSVTATFALQFELDAHGDLAAAGTVVELGAGRHLLNPGSVGQPRNGDPRAAWLEIDNSSGRATFRRTEYPVERTQAEMRERGLPELLAERLAHGV